MAFGRAPFGATPFGGGRGTAGVVTLPGAIAFKRRSAVASPVTMTAVRDAAGDQMVVTLSSGVYATTDPNEIWLLRNVFQPFVEEV